MITEITSIAEAPPAALQHTAGGDGLFAEYEKIHVPMSTGTACAFYLAHTPDGLFYGFEFFIRSPKNHVKKIPKLQDGPSDTLDQKKRLLLWIIDTLAKKFFSDHKAGAEKLADFRALVAAEAELPTISAQQAEYSVSSDLPALKDSELPETASGAAEQALREQLRSEVATRQLQVATPSQRGRYAEIAVAEIEINPGNPRKSRSAEKFAELVESLRSTGELLQPIAVRDLGEGREGKPDTKRYQLIFGEGRWLAAQQLGWLQIEAKVYTGCDAGVALEMALIENLQREDMNAMDEAEGFAELSRLGRSPAEMADRTGKDLSTINRSLSLVKLPEEVRGMVRTSALSARQASRLIRWVSPKGVKGKNAPADFVARPLVCVAIAETAAMHGISSDALAVGVPPQAVSLLLERELLTEVPEKYVPAFNGGLADTAENIEKYFTVDGRLFTFDEAGWKAVKKDLDTAAREATKQAAKKASTKVESRISVPVADLEKSKTKFVEMSAEDEKRYADHLPKDSCTLGVAKSGAEVMLCIKPEHLAQLKKAEAEAIIDDRGKAVERIFETIRLRLRKLKKIGAREMAWIASIILPPNGSHCIVITMQDFAGQSIKAPKNFAAGQGLTVLELAKYSPVEIVRLLLSAALGFSCQDVGDDSFDDFKEIARWLLDAPKLGLIEEDAKAQVDLLSQISEHLWPNPAGDVPFGNDTPAPVKKKPTKKSPKKSRK